MINPHAMEVGEKRIEGFFQKLHLGENGFNIRKWLFFIKKPHCFSLTYGIRWIRSVSGTPPLFAYGKIDIFRRDGFPKGRIMPIRKFVVQIQAFQIFAVHLIGHPRPVRVPRHDVERP